jgi:CDP-glucose 4,6-dehydratase
VRRIAALMGKRHLQPRILNYAKHEIPHQVLLADKARERLGWQPGHTLQRGLRETIDWYTDFLAAEASAA